MNFRSVLIILLLLFLFVSCQGRNGDKPEEKTVENKVNLTVNRDQLDNQSETAPRDPPPSPDTQPDSEMNEPPPRREYFLSGRTDLLALSRSESVKALGFSLGELYFDKTASAEDKAIVSICLNFFEGLMIGDFRANQIESKRQLEIKDYWLYFIKDQISFTEVIMGKPVNAGQERQVMFLLRPDNQEGLVYLKKDGNRWLLTGLELDLREKPANASTEKWAPSVKPSPFGY